MIDTIATRRFTLGDTEYEEGQTVPMPLQQFQDLEPTGLVKRAPAKTAAGEKAAPKPRTARPKATKAPVAAPTAPATESRSSDAAD